MKVNKSISSLATPLSSIFGSGFLIIVPILAAAVGKYSIFAMALVCFVAFLVGSVIRFNIKNVEPLIENKTASKSTTILDYLSDFLLIPAYIISVILYLKILASFALEPFNADNVLNENILVTGILIFILIVSLVKGLKSLSFLENISLNVTFIIIAFLLGGFLIYDISVLQNGITWPTPMESSVFDKIRIISGTLIVVQGFETTRYLSYEYDTKTRIDASRNSQIISTIVYLVFILLATPITFSLDLQGSISNNDLIHITKVAVPLLVFPLIIAAMLSQFSASIADTFGASGNLKEITKNKITVKKASLLIISISIILTWVIGSSTIVSLASRAFAIYYFLQCLVALSVATKKKEKVFFILLSIILLFIVFFAVSVG